jgi:hypothetical protein
LESLPPSLLRVGQHLDSRAMGHPRGHRPMRTCEMRRFLSPDLQLGGLGRVRLSTLQRVDVPLITVKGQPRVHSAVVPDHLDRATALPCTDCNDQGVQDMRARYLLLVAVGAAALRLRSYFETVRSPSTAGDSIAGFHTHHHPAAPMSLRSPEEPGAIRERTAPSPSATVPTLTSSP